MLLSEIVNGGGCPRMNFYFFITSNTLVRGYNPVKRT